ncbi:MAG: dihydroorotate dehydrogenase electron transfer subunit [Planctomycetales bacterium]|nr:dihydroorotate dehydrogenase electron transfer subunit [Planctomycetales bacterium]
MSTAANPLHASCYADNACHETVTIVENVQVARDTFRARFECPAIAERITPGQFLMVRLANLNDPILGRPFAMYDVIHNDAGNRSAVDVVYLVGGKMTTRFREFRPGQKLEVWGPLGNGFMVEPDRDLIMVAGGIGQTPFLALGKEALGKQQYGDRSVATVEARSVKMCYGARNAEYFAGVDDFRAAGVDLRLSTDDGSTGHHGLVTDLLSIAIDESESTPQVVCCGPEPMMEAVANLTAERGVPCNVSLETPMACGIGICFTCVAKVLDESGEWDYKRTCVEGPVFDAKKIAW